MKDFGGAYVVVKRNKIGPLCKARGEIFFAHILNNGPSTIAELREVLKLKLPTISVILRHLLETNKIIRIPVNIKYVLKNKPEVLPKYKTQSRIIALLETGPKTVREISEILATEAVSVRYVAAKLEMDGVLTKTTTATSFDIARDVKLKLKFTPSKYYSVKRIKCGPLTTRSHAAF